MMPSNTSTFCSNELNRDCKHLARLLQSSRQKKKKNFSVNSYVTAPNRNVTLIGRKCVNWRTSKLLWWRQHQAEPWTSACVFKPWQNNKWKLSGRIKSLVFTLLFCTYLGFNSWNTNLFVYVNNLKFEPRKGVSMQNLETLIQNVRQIHKINLGRLQIFAVELNDNGKQVFCFLI